MTWPAGSSTGRAGGRPGLQSLANRAILQRGGGHYVVAERLRHANNEAKEALARPGRYHHTAGNLGERVRRQEETERGARAKSLLIAIGNAPFPPT